MRKRIVAGNWKMNKNLQEGIALMAEVIPMVEDEVLTPVNIIIAPPFIHLYSISQLLKANSKITLAAQNCSEQGVGAYTGEVSCQMLASVGVSWVIIGHSERRQYFFENSKQLSEKVNQALEAGLQPIYCCGEPLQEREAQNHLDFIERQIQEVLFQQGPLQAERVVIAYEPIWAIGTGHTASADQIQEVHAFIRNLWEQKYGKNSADHLSLLYGGSVNPSNASAIFNCEDVDGALVGGASLKSRDFLEIIKALKK